MDTYPLAHMKVNKRDLTYREIRLSSVENTSLFFDLGRIFKTRGARNSVTFIISEMLKYVSYYQIREFYSITYITVAQFSSINGVQLMSWTQVSFFITICSMRYAFDVKYVLTATNA